MLHGATTLVTKGTKDTKDTKDTPSARVVLSL
jgi:hypothetical protein